MSEDPVPNAPSTDLRVAVAQAASTPGDLAANVAKAVEFVDRADNEGADLVVFGELFLPGYHLGVLAEDPDGCDVEADGEHLVADTRLDPLREIVQHHHLSVLMGASVRRDGERHIAQLLIDRYGLVHDVYHKQQVWDEENALYTRGDQGGSVELASWNLGLGICYDACFPEHARAAAADGAHAYVVGGAYLTGGGHRRDLYHAARALDNTFYTVFAGAVGGSDPWAFGGGSAIYDPEGRVLARVDDDTEGIAAADLDPQRLAETRREHTMLADRPLEGLGGRRVTKAPGA
ncbi:carbon-nitrogen hydrolase [Actinorhabdospora filicis]|uniref:Carbon-nitrogen hydrolase n=1 Tax=Actinorhabdospora filicis TaxID=1785913 RepID=A0A9W6SN02_9ACTN|nr:carbon-nitrogen hydrolase family protein [Actinorhabdospora filicis]GLZ78882.1 carbon-nitrogen hydrolase [Actinorhabdospora filicis]